MTVTRNTFRAATGALAASLVLSACSSTPNNNSKIASPANGAEPSSSAPSWTPPAPGHWTKEDLQVGRVVPREELERLYPVWDKPTPPPTLAENTEQGAKDAAIYFAELFEFGLRANDPSVVNEMDGGFCENCDNLRGAIAPNHQVFRASAEFRPSELHRYTERESMYEVGVQLRAGDSVGRDPTSGEIQFLGNAQGKTAFYTVFFANNTWQAYIAAADRSRWHGE